MGKVIINFDKNPLQILQRSPLDIMIDGKPRCKVGSKIFVEIEVETGLHSIQMSFKYLGEDCGIAYIMLSINENETYMLTYKPPIIAYSNGTIVVNKI